VKRSEGENAGRVFFALWPDERVRDALNLTGERLKTACGGRLMQKETLHLTLVFIGNVLLERLPELKSLAARVEAGAFDLMLGKTGWWSHNRIAWAAPNATPEPLQELVSRLQAALRQAGFDFDGRQEYAPHVTLLRNAVCEAETMPAAEPVPWPVGEFVLLQSMAGASYQILGRWKLGLA
jgi:2'-5' RNA ligase